MPALAGPVQSQPRASEGSGQLKTQAALQKTRPCPSFTPRLPRTRECALQQQLADRFGLPVTVCHYPTGASKWNPVEHRLFSEISKHWAGQPLDSFPTILRLISETTTQTGLRVNSRLVTKHYETGRKVSDQEMRELRLKKHRTLPEWNYTLYPRENRN